MSPCLHLEPQERLPGAQKDSQHPFPHKNLAGDAEMHKQKALDDLNYLLLAGICTGLGSVKKPQEFTSQITIPVIIVCSSFNGLPDLPKMRAIIFTDIFHHNLPKLINPHFPTKAATHLPQLLYLFLFETMISIFKAHHLFKAFFYQAIISIGSWM